MANRPKNMPDRDTPEWQRFFDCRRARYRPSRQRPDTPEWRKWWDASAAKLADADYALHQALMVFQQETVQQARNSGRGGEERASPKSPLPDKRMATEEEVYTHLRAFITRTPQRAARGRDKSLAPVRESLSDAGLDVTDALIGRVHLDARLDPYVIRRKRKS